MTGARSMLSLAGRVRAGIARAILPGGMDVGWPTGGGGMAYDAARVSRRDPDWVPQPLGPNAQAEQQGGLARIRARARDLADNNELVDAAAETVVDAVVGTGLDDLEPDTGIPALDDQIRPVLATVLCRVDPERKMTLSAQQQLAQRELAIAGEVGVLETIAPAFNGYPSMPAAELVDADRIPLDIAGELPGGNVVRQGVEYDPKGRVVAYHVLRHNPRDEQWFSGGMAMASFGSKELVRLPSTNFRLLFDRRRVGQLRGVPPWVSVMRTLRTEDGYFDSTMLLAQLVSSMGIVMESNNAEMFKRKDGKAGEYAAVDSAGNPVSVIRGLQMIFTKPGSKPPTPITPNVPGQQFGEVCRWLLRKISRGFGLRYDESSGDYSQTTFASGRLGLLDAHRKVQRKRENLLDNHTYPLVRLAIDWGVLTSKIDLGTLTAEERAKIDAEPEILYRTGIGLPGPGAVNPYQEAQAEQTEIASGTLSRVMACSAKGRSARRVIEDEAKYEKMETEIRTKHGLGPKQPLAKPGEPKPGSPEDPNHDPDEAEKKGKPGDDAASGGIDDGVGLARARSNRLAAAYASIEHNGRLNGAHHA